MPGPGPKVGGGAGGGLASLGGGLRLGALGAPKKKEEKE